MMCGNGLLIALGKILDPRWYALWPSEFHFCGCDSEPLLSDQVVTGIRFLLQRDRVVELITNGLLLDKPALIETAARIDKLSVSLDVTNDEDYATHKFPVGSTHTDGYSTVLKNLQSIAAYRQEYRSSLNISVTFVATPRTYDRDRWRVCFEQLQDAGVNEIRVRDDLNQTYGPPIAGLKNEIEEVGRSVPNMQVRFISPAEPYSEFAYCRGPRLWPALAADGCLYPCAHMASSKYQPFGDLLAAPSLLELYRDLFQARGQNFVPVAEIGCRRECPSVLGLYCDPLLAAKQLGGEKYA